MAHPPPETANTLINFPPPTWLKHSPIYMLPYEHFDGRYAFHTDAKYLSVGLAQWRYDSDDDAFAMSVKAWRKPNERWSRENEDPPIHRNVDMTIMLAYVPFRAGLDVELPANTFGNQSTPITLTAMAEFPGESAPYQERCRARLRVLRDVLNRLGPPTAPHSTAE